LKPETEAETEALTIQAGARPRTWLSELETETRPKNACHETEVLATEAETKAFSVETEAKTKTLSLEAEARPRRFEISTEARPSRGTTAPRDGLESRDRGI